MDNISVTDEENITVVNNASEKRIMSKRQLKKVKKREKWLERKAEKRLRERAKARAKRAFARANNFHLGPSRKFLKQSTMAASTCKLTVTIDLSFDELMLDRDISKVVKQILRCYTLNRRASAPMQFSLTSFTGKSRTVMEKNNGYEHWDVSFYTMPYMNVYPKEKIIYLTSESENVIDDLSQDYVYVIGGLVDHNAHKGICYKLAVEAGVRHGRLPLDKYLRMKARKVLTIDHEGCSWQDAFLKVLPERKNAQPIIQSVEEKLHDAEPINVNNTMLIDEYKEENDNKSVYNKKVKEISEKNVKEILKETVKEISEKTAKKFSEEHECVT
ncbi:tRNA methyltransferase 10 homolog A isoform X2 [Pseudomyrmex gracilis]|uniref:tRNA methyltransferase 10 homolog A isoform X2 n=1 Tax=Pseudomyrmex gracilis TaxID=219809 RepID=UPI0009951332|nr:tRNA methyltransferase 10 homolog A isoform X2 [Pseudomyrmex gracilis]